jgi:hypothetical protein
MTSFGPVFRWSRRMGAGKIPADVLDVIDRAVADDPARRFQEAAAFRRTLAAALHKRAPGYSAEELASELRQLGAWSGPGDEATEVGKTPSGRPAPSQTTADAGRDALATHAETTAPELFAEEQRATAPFADERRPTGPFVKASPGDLAWSDIPDLPPVGPVAVAAPAPVPHRPSVLDGFLDGELLASAKRRLLTPRAGLVAAGAAATILALVLAISIGGASTAAPIAAPAPRAMAQPLSTPLPQTGTLSVEGPTGASVTIGATSYPPAPCRVELPPGDYAVRVKRHARGRAVVRHVTIEAGRAVSLRI